MQESLIFLPNTKESAWRRSLLLPSRRAKTPPTAPKNQEKKTQASLSVRVFSAVWMGAGLPAAEQPALRAGGADAGLPPRSRPRPPRSAKPRPIGLGAGPWEAPRRPPGGTPGRFAEPLSPRPRSHTRLGPRLKPQPTWRRRVNSRRRRVRVAVPPPAWAEPVGDHPKP